MQDTILNLFKSKLLAFGKRVAQSDGRTDASKHLSQKEFGLFNFLEASKAGEGRVHFTFINCFPNLVTHQQLKTAVKEVTKFYNKEEPHLMAVTEQDWADYLNYRMEGNLVIRSWSSQEGSYPRAQLYRDARCLYLSFFEVAIP